MRSQMGTAYTETMHSDEIRKEMGRLLASRNTHKIGSTTVSIVNDYINYRYEMSYSMAMALLKKLRQLPKYEEMV